MGNELDERENPATLAKDDFNEQERAQAKRMGAVMDDVRLIKSLLADHDARARRQKLHATLDRILDWRDGKRRCVGDRFHAVRR